MGDGVAILCTVVAVGFAVAAVGAVFWETVKRK